VASGSLGLISLKSLKVIAIIGIIILASVLDYTFFKPPRPSSPTRLLVIQDFAVNNTWAGQSSTFSFQISADGESPESAAFACNVTGTMANDSSVQISNPTHSEWLNFTHTLPSINCTIAFQFWVWNTNNASQYGTTGPRNVNVYAYNSTAGAWNTPFTSLSQAIQTVDAANNWTNADPYAQTILSKYTTAQLQSMIDNYSSAKDWADVLTWATVCNKLWYNTVPSDVQTDIEYALENFTMVGYLPCTITEVDPYSGNSENCFSVESGWALYGFYFNNCSWMGSYQNNAKWNVTAAYTQFDQAVNNSLSADNPEGSGLPLWTFYWHNGTSGLSQSVGWSYSNRYFDECADTIECYLLFDELLNVSDGMNKALSSWNYLVSTHWNSAPGYFQYMPGVSGQLYECEGAFFLEVTSQLKYYYPTLGNWTDVLTDVANRFLTQEWNSCQWLDWTNNLTTYVVAHAYSYTGSPIGTNQRRLGETVGAWQALIGAYLSLNSTFQANLDDMLLGNQNTQPAWADLLSQYTGEGAGGSSSGGAGLYDGTLFGWRNQATSGYGGIFTEDQNATAWAEILMFMMGIVPVSTTVASPLEMLGGVGPVYSGYVYSIDPVIMTMNISLNARQVSIPVAKAGTITFLYGESPITCNFTHAGVYRVTFSNSWNMITNATLISTLPSNVIYFPTS